MIVIYSISLLIYLIGVIFIVTAKHEAEVIFGLMVFVLGGIFNLLAIIIYLIKGIKAKAWSLTWGALLFAPILISLVIKVIFVK